MNKAKLIRQIHSRLGRLEDNREIARLGGTETDDIDVEITSLRVRLKEVMNSPCPVLKDESNGKEEEN